VQEPHKLPRGNETALKTGAQEQSDVHKSQSDRRTHPASIRIAAIVNELARAICAENQTLPFMGGLSSVDSAW
jgi:hypothetical protein